jgi:hypothetical protein
MFSQSSRRALIAALCACAIGWTTILPSWGQTRDLGTPIATSVQATTLAEIAKDREILDLRGRIEALERRLNAAAPETLPSAIATAEGLAPMSPTLAERALERTLVRNGALLLPRGQVELEPTLSYARAERADAGLFNVEGGGATLGQQTRVRANRSLDVTLRAGLPFNAQAEIGIAAVNAERTVTSTVNGEAQTTRLRETSAGDLRIGLAKTLLRERGALPDLVGRVTWDTDTGQSRGDLSAGSGFNEIELGLTAIKRQDPLVFVAGLQAQRALVKDGLRPGNSYSGFANVSLAVSPETSLRMGLRYSRIEAPEVNGRAIVGAEATPVSLSLGVGSVIGRQRFVDVGVDIGLTDDAPQVALAVTLPLRGRLPFGRGN